MVPGGPPERDPGRDEAGAAGDAVDDVLRSARDEEVDPTTPGELLSLVVGSVVLLFGTRFDELRDVVVEAQRRSAGPGARPRRVADAGEALTRDERRRVEALVDRHLRSLEAFAADLAAGLDADPAVAAPDDGYPPAEWGVAGIAVLAGPRRVREATERVAAELAALGGPSSAYGMAYFAWRTTADAPSALMRAVVTAAVTEFEALLAALLRIGLLLHPEALGVDPQQVTPGEPRAGGGTADAPRSPPIERVVARYLAPGVTDWSSRLARAPGIALAELTASWPELVEVFLRRNVIVHHNARVDALYLGRLPKELDAPRLGAPVDPDAAYALAALDRLRLAGDALAALWLPTLRPGTGVDEHLAASTVERAIEHERWSDAAVLGTRFQDLIETPGTQHVVRVNTWLARRQAAGAVDEIAADVAAWEPPSDDWEWRIARPALLGDGPGTDAVVRAAAAAGVSVAEFREWPLLRLLGASYPPLRRTLAGRPGLPVQPRTRKRKRR